MNEASNQEWTMVVIGLDRVTNVSEIETSLVHFLEGSVGIIETQRNICACTFLVCLCKVLCVQMEYD
eukprot:c50024_g1_i1 orf=2-199(-)